MNEMILATNPREFLKSWLESKKQSGRSVSFEYISKKAGFASRSFVRQVFLGEKPMTMKSFPRFVKAMDLDKNHENLLRFLLAMEVDDFNVDGKSNREIEVEIQKLREKIRNKKSKNISKSKIGDQQALAMTRLYPYLMRTTGQSFENIKSKSSLADADLKTLLAEGVRNELVVKKENLFYASERLLQVQEESKTVFLKNYVNSGLHLMKDQLNRLEGNSHDGLFLRAQYSVDRSKVPEFKERLRSLMVEFAESTESDKGENLINLICGFF